ncbi:replicative DNA helicase [Acuticoccus yangtzensis]|uniref:replicative DNA helicase n=1 Tax=Acuticoccus yangtzensis TaxID=1443441 RepID=UPI0009495EC3|nr:replicative DNA helicase [Acuticoccus yangtzensis]ORE96393.1 DNA helicase, DnaB type [Stappia sp. 22II-S9-Z10]
MNQPLDHTALEIRQAPHNIEIEQQLLGLILVNNEAFYRVSDFLKTDHFFIEPHRRIYDLITKLIRSGKVATPSTVKTFLPADQPLADLAPVEYLTRLAANATTIINAEDYGRNLFDLAMRRELITIGEDLVNESYDATPDMTPRAQIEGVERRLYGLAEGGAASQGFVTFSDALTASVEMADAAFHRAGALSGIATHLTDLDRLMGGLQRSDLVVLAGRPAMGKTSLVTNIGFAVARAYRAGLENGVNKTLDGGIVGFFSLEMSAEQLATRILAEQSGISSSLIRRGAFEEHQFQDLVGAATAMQTLPFFIDQTGGISIGALAARARRLKRQKGLDLLIVDYLQLLSGSGKPGASRVNEITEITTGLKALAKELEVPIIALSQLSRQVENRDDKRPQLADLRESGSIEQDADVVLFVYREEYYLQARKPPEGSQEFFEWEAKMEACHGVAEVIVAKQRHGPTGTVKLQFEAELTRFGNLAPEHGTAVSYE